MTQGKDVQTALFEFAQAAFAGDLAPHGDERMADVLALMAEFRSLRADTVIRWPVQTRAAARELLTRAVMFVSLFPDLPFPSDFLEGTTPRRLGEPVVSWLHERAIDLATLDPARRAR